MNTVTWVPGLSRVGRRTARRNSSYPSQGTHASVANFESNQPRQARLRFVAFQRPAAYNSRMTPEVSYRYITRIPGVRSGAALVAGTRIGVHDVVGLMVNGASVDDVVRSFPELTRAQVFECLAYYEDHRDEIDWRVAEQMAEGPG